MTLLYILLATACANITGQSTGINDQIDPSEGETNQLSIPDLKKVDLKIDENLKVIATSSIIGDVVFRVGGENIFLTILMGAGQDPHSFEPSARDLTAVAEADVIFVNGWDLEAGLLDDIKNVAEGIPLVPISAGISPIPLDVGYDPHVWMNPQNVLQWVENVTFTFSKLDPPNEADYKSNAAIYKIELDRLIGEIENQLSGISERDRKLITNHDSLGYFAAAYGFEILGTIIPGGDTLAEPSASSLSALVTLMAEEKICALYAETTSNNKLAQSVASELEDCESVQILSLYTGALGPSGSGVDSYIGMMESNVNSILAGIAGNDE